MQRIQDCCERLQETVAKLTIQDKQTSLAIFDWSDTWGSASQLKQGALDLQVGSGAQRYLQSQLLNQAALEQGVQLQSKAQRVRPSRPVVDASKSTQVSKVTYLLDTPAIRPTPVQAC